MHTNVPRRLTRNTLIAYHKRRDPSTDLDDPTGEIVALSFGEGCGPHLRESAFPNPDLPRVESGGDNADDDLTRRRRRDRDSDHSQYALVAVPVKSDRTGHDLVPS
jgi:hypothetical protein